MNFMRDPSIPEFPSETVRNGQLLVFEIVVIHANPMGGVSSPKTYDAVVDNSGPRCSWKLVNAKRLLGSQDFIVKWSEKSSVN